MGDIYVRPHKDQGFALFRGNTMLAYGLDAADAKEFSRIYMQSAIVGEGTAKMHGADIVAASQRSVAERTGVGFFGKRRRRLILEDHVETIRSMVTDNPSTTKRDIERRLRSNGVSFSSNTAITNLARIYDIKLRA